MPPVTSFYSEWSNHYAWCDAMTARPTRQRVECTNHQGRRNIDHAPHCGCSPPPGEAVADDHPTRVIPQRSAAVILLYVSNSAGAVTDEQEALVLGAYWLAGRVVHDVAAGVPRSVDRQDLHSVALLGLVNAARVLRSDARRAVRSIRAGRGCGGRCSTSCGHRTRCHAPIGAGHRPCMPLPTHRRIAER